MTEHINTNGRPETDAEKQTRESLSGEGPYSDSVGPDPERLAKYQAKVLAMQASLEKRQYRVDDSPLGLLTKKLSKVTFFNPLNEDELKKARRMCIDPAFGKENRRGCNFAFIRYMRSQFYAGFGMRVLCLRRISEAAEVFRVTDMARVIMWKYRKPGCFGAELTNEHLNFSMSRAQNDIDANPDIAALIQEYLDTLFAQGILSKTAPENTAPSTRARRGKHFRTATVMEKAAELETRMGELAKGLDALRELQGTVMDVFNKRFDAFSQGLGKTISDLSVRQDTLEKLSPTPLTDPAEQRLSALEQAHDNAVKRIEAAEARLDAQANIATQASRSMQEQCEGYEAAQREIVDKCNQLSMGQANLSLENIEIKEAIEGVKSHHATCNGVTIQALNRNQADTEACATSVEQAHLKNEQLLEKVKQLTEILVRALDRIEVLEQRLNTPVVLAPTPFQTPHQPPSDTRRWPDVYQPSVTCEKSGVTPQASV